MQAGGLRPQTSADCRREPSWMYSTICRYRVTPCDDRRLTTILDDNSTDTSRAHTRGHVPVSQIRTRSPSARPTKATAAASPAAPLRSHHSTTAATASAQYATAAPSQCTVASLIRCACRLHQVHDRQLTSSSPRRPVAGASMSVSNGDDENTAWLNAIDDRVRKAPEEVTPGAVLETRPRLWKSNYRGLGFGQFVAERKGCRCAALRIPACRGLGFEDRSEEHT